MIFQQLVEGIGRIQIARNLDKLGVEPPLGGDYWSTSSLTAIIKNEVYMGHIIWGKFNYTKRNGEYIRKKVPPEQWIRCENAHEPLVSEELFKQANLAHSGRWQAPTIERKELANPLAGILRCGLCNHVMRYFPTYEGRRPQARCVQPSCHGKQAGSVFSMVEEKILEGLDQIVQEFVVTNRQRKKREIIVRSAEGSSRTEGKRVARTTRPNG